MDHPIKENGMAVTLYSSRVALACRSHAQSTHVATCIHTFSRSIRGDRCELQHACSYTRAHTINMHVARVDADKRSRRIVLTFCAFQQHPFASHCDRLMSRPLKNSRSAECQSHAYTHIAYYFDLLARATQAGLNYHMGSGG